MRYLSRVSSRPRRRTADHPRRAVRPLAGDTHTYLTRDGYSPPHTPARRLSLETPRPESLSFCPLAFNSELHTFHAGVARGTSAGVEEM